MLPGTRNSVAVSLHMPSLAPSFGGVVIFDDGTARRLKTAEHTGASRMVRGPSDFLFGFNNESTGDEFYTPQIVRDGVRQTEHRDLLEGEGYETDLSYGFGYLYASSGEVLDVTTPMQPVRAGKHGLVSWAVAEEDLIGRHEPLLRAMPSSPPTPCANSALRCIR